MDIKSTQPIGPVTLTSTAVNATSASSANASSTAPPDTLRLSGLVALLQSGQRFEALVIALEGKTMLLQLPQPLLDAQGNQTWVQLRAPADIPVNVGQRLLLEVMQSDPTQPQLKIVPTVTTELTVQTALATVAAKQQPITPLYANIAWLNQKNAMSILQTFPTPVRDQIQTLWRQIPDSEQIQNPLTLRQAIHNSGVFLEANVLRMIQNERAFPVMDLRVALLRLAAAIREQAPSSTAQAKSIADTGGSQARSSASAIPVVTNMATTSKETLPAMLPQIPLPQAQAKMEPTLADLKSLPLMLEHVLQQTEASVARQQVQQLLPQVQEPPRPAWLLELPVRHEQGVDVFDMRIQRDGKQNDTDATASWTIMLAFDLDGLGPIRVQISLHQNVISSYWWAENFQTVNLFHQHLDVLKSRLQANGLQVEQLRCQHGNTQPVLTQKPLPYANHSIDENI